MKTVTVRDLETRHLLALDAIVSTGTFAQAAQQLGYTQSAVSQQVAALERAVGGAVFDRGGGARRALLTPLGQVLAAQGALVLREIEHAATALEAFHAGSGALAVGTFQSISSTVLPELLIALREQDPQVELRVVEEDDTATFNDRLIEGRLDVAFIVGPPGPGLTGVDLFTDPFYVIARPQDVADGPVPATQLRDSPLIAEQQNTCQNQLDEQLAAIGVPPNYVLRASDNAAVTAMVGAGLGLAVRSLLSINTADPRIVVRSTDPPLGTRTISLAWPTGRTLSPLAARAVQLALDLTAARRKNTQHANGQGHPDATDQPAGHQQ